MYLDIDNMTREEKLAYLQDRQKIWVSFYVQDIVHPKNRYYIDMAFDREISFMAGQDIPLFNEFMQMSAQLNLTLENLEIMKRYRMPIADYVGMGKCIENPQPYINKRMSELLSVYRSSSVKPQSNNEIAKIFTAELKLLYGRRDDLVVEHLNIFWELLHEEYRNKMHGGFKANQKFDYLKACFEKLSLPNGSPEQLESLRCGLISRSKIWTRYFCSPELKDKDFDDIQACFKTECEFLEKTEQSTPAITQVFLQYNNFFMGKERIKKNSRAYTIDEYQKDLNQLIPNKEEYLAKRQKFLLNRLPKESVDRELMDRMLFMFGREAKFLLGDIQAQDKIDNLNALCEPIRDSKPEVIEQQKE